MKKAAGILLGILGVILLFSAVNLYALAMAVAILAAIMGLTWVAAVIYRQHWITKFWAMVDAKKAER